MSNITCDFVKTDITFVKFFHNHIFVGNGCYLYIYKNCKYLERIHIFEQHIFGTSVDEKHNKILVYGGKFMKVYALDLFTLNFKEQDLLIAPDWILAAKFMNNGKYVVTVSMHNVVTLYDSFNKLALIEIKECTERCISYCAHLVNEHWNDLIILSGTVFNQILLWQPTKSSDRLCPVKSRLVGHKGVIFCIDYHPKLNVICTTSDDRTAIIWEIKEENLSKGLSSYSIDIQPTHILAGHIARVFKCKILDNFTITAGEDGIVNIWNSRGEIFRKIDVHQNAPVWSLDYCEDTDEVVTGGGDGGVFLFKLHSTPSKKLLPIYKCETPKRIVLLSEHSLICLCESGVLIHYNVKGYEFIQIFCHDDLKSYALLEKAPCGSCIALAGFTGNLHIYRHTENCLIYRISCQIAAKQRIFSLHWLSCRSLITCEARGVITMWIIDDETIVPVHFWELPRSKERWTTTACSCGSKYVIVGDRRGSIFLYSFDSSQAVQVIKRAHNYLGITRLYFFEADNRIVSLGRNSTVNEYQLDTSRGRIDQTSTHKVPFAWLTSLYGAESKKCTLLSGFSGTNLVIYDYIARRILLEIDCGGGHRSWDCHIANNQLTFAYVKDKRINLQACDLADIRGSSIVQGYHSSEINVLKLLKRDMHTLYFISGGEDTVLRLCCKDINNDRADFSNVKMLKSHLSSIRSITAVKIGAEKYLVFSGGGRSQILLWELSFNSMDGEMMTNCIEKCNNYEQNDLIETRVMTMSAITIRNDVFLLAGYSDGHVKVFRVDSGENPGKKLNQIKDIVAHKSRCILQISTLSIDGVYILISMATDGVVVFTNVTDIFSTLADKPFVEGDVIMASFKLHQSGINSFDYCRWSATKFVFLTGGDDTAISLNVFDIETRGKGAIVKRDSCFVDESYHVAQVSGVRILERYFLTTSGDQKVLLFKWDLLEDEFEVECVEEYESGICDIQGMECELFGRDVLKVFVYGRGCEILTVELPKS